MANEFDSILNRMIDLRADDWAAFLAARAGVPPGPATAEDTRLSVSAQADKVFRIDGPQPALVHLEMESWSHLGVPATLKWYNDLLTRTHGLPVLSVLVLLRRKAVASDQTGVYEVRGPGDQLIHQFHYRVVRLWEESLDGLLSGGPGLAPLALLTDDAAGDLNAAFGRMERRLRSPDVPVTLTQELLSAGFVLGGLRYDTDELVALYQRLNMTLEDSTTYQWLIRRGVQQGEQQWRAAEASSMLLKQGRKKFGLDPTAEPRLKAITDIDRLERMAERIFDATSWDDLLSTP
jgi:hypothetical protein